MYNVIIGIVFAIYLLKKYSETKGKFIKAKIFHFVSILYIMIVNSDSLGMLFKLFFKKGELKILLSKNLSEFDGTINYFNSIIYAFLSFLLFTYGIGLIQLMENIRKVFVDFVLFLIPFSAIQIFMIAKQKASTLGNLDLFISLFVAILLYLPLYLIYRSKFMADYFSFRKTDTINKLK